MFLFSGVFVFVGCSFSCSCIFFVCLFLHVAFLGLCVILSSCFSCFLVVSIPKFQSMPFVSHVGVKFRAGRCHSKACRLCKPSNEATNGPQKPTNPTNKATRLGLHCGGGAAPSPAPLPLFFEADQSNKATQEGILPWNGTFLRKC